MRLLFIIGFVALSFRSSNAHLEDISENPGNYTLDSEYQEILWRLKNISDKERSEAVTELTNCANKFTLNLYKNFSVTTNKSYVLAGYSTFKAMGMAAAGARIDTKEQIRKVLQLPINKRKIFAGFEEIQRTLKDIPDSIVRSNTDLWYSYSVNLKSNYKYILDRIYDVTFQPYFFLGPNRTMMFFQESRFTCKLMGEKRIIHKGEKILEVIKPTENYKYGQLPEINATFIEIPCMEPAIKYDDIQMDELPQPTKSNTRAISMFFLFTNGSFKELENNIEKMSVKKLFSGESIYKDIWMPLISTRNNTDIKEQLVRMGLTEMFSEKSCFYNIANEVKLDVSISDATLEIVEISDLLNVLPIYYEIPDEYLLTVPFISVVTTTGDNPLILQMGRHMF